MTNLLNDIPWPAAVCLAVLILGTIAVLVESFWSLD